MVLLSRSGELSRVCIQDEERGQECINIYYLGITEGGFGHKL